MTARFKNIARTLFLMACAVFLFAPAGATLQGLQTGMEAPDFSLKTISGETRKFADLRGEKLTVVIFWSTWSKKSETVLVRMQKLQNKYRDKGFSVIAVNADDQKLSPQTIEEIQKMVQRLKLDYHVVLDQGLATFHSYGVISLPSTLILDKERVIKYELSGYPLEGAEEMADFITSTLEGKKQVHIAIKTGHQPGKDALRLFNMGKTTMLSKRMADTADAWFKKAIDADPDFVQPYLSLGKIYIRKGETAMAQTMFEKALAKEPGNIIAMCESAMAMVNDGKVDQGQLLLEKALKTGDGYTPCYYYTGFVYGKKGDLVKAMQMFDEAARMNPMDSLINVYRAKTYEENNKQPEAVAAYKKALETILNLN